MTRRLLAIGSICIAVSLFLALAVFPVSVQGQQSSNRQVVDTGVVALGPNQVLKLTIISTGDHGVRVRFNFMDYTDDSCAIGVPCLKMLAFEDTTAPVNLAPDEAVSFAVTYTSPSVANRIRALAVSQGQQTIKATVEIRDTATGQVTSFSPSFVDKSVPWQ